MGTRKYANGFQLTLHDDDEVLNAPLAWKKPQLIFVNSMSDLFHKDVPLAFIRRVFEVMRGAHWHTFQILTKRSQRLQELGSLLDWAPNVWMGVSVESSEYRFRIDHLRHVPAAVRFLSIEPLIGRVGTLNLDEIGWVIVGGESGPGSRDMEKCWVTEIQDQCVSKGVPFFFKQWGGTNKKKAGRLLDGKVWDELPASVNERPLFA